MKKILFIVAILFASFLSSQKTYAIAYGAGGEIMYQYINDSTYRFYYKFMRACTGIGENNEFSLCYRNTCSNVWFTKILSKSLLTPWGTPNGQMVDPGCADQPNACTNPSSTLEMYREWWYTGIVVLTEPCDDWAFSVNITERDRTFLTNLAIMPISQHNLYVEATLKPLSQPKQSSPYFTIPPPVYTCVDATFRGNLGVIDPDGDSLVYKLIQPRAATTDIFVVCAGYPPYDMPFAGPQYNLTNNPLLTNNTFNLNAQTGDYSFTPTGNQVAYLAFLVEKYRNNQLIGTVMRDSRIEVNTCTAPPIQFNLNTVSLTGATMSNDTIVVCGNTKVNFCYTAQTTTTTASLLLKDNSKIALKGSNVAIQNQGAANVTGCVTWTPQRGDVGFKYLIVSVKDSTCGSGYPVTQSFKIPILVKPGTFAIAKDSIICPGASTELYGFGGNTFNWTIHPDDSMSSVTCGACDTAIVSPTAPSTRYILTSNLGNGCSATDTVTVKVDYSTSINITTPGPIVLCDGEAYIQLASQASGAKPLKTIACGPYSPQCTGIMDSAQLAETSNNSWSNNMMYTYAEYWGPFYAEYKTQKMQVVYRKSELRSVGMQSGTLQKMSLNFGPFTGQAQTFNNVKISLRCTDKNEFTATSQVEFETGLTEVFSAASVTLTPGWNDFNFLVPYDYDTTKNLVVQFCYTNVVPGIPVVPGGAPTTSMLPIYYVTTDYKSSIWSGQLAAGDACANSIGTIRLDRRKPDTRFVFCELPETDFIYTWTPGTGMDNPGAASTGVIADESKWYTVSTVGRYGCVVKDSIYVHVADNHFKMEPDYAEICSGEAVQLNVIDAYKGLWFDENYNIPTYMSCTGCLSPSIFPTVPGLYPFNIIASDSFGCADTLQASVLVKPVPATNILNNDTTIQYGQSVRLYVEGAETYLWTPVSYVDDPRSPSPLVSPLENTMYIVTGYLEDGCHNSDSVWVKVDRSGAILIPSAFSPNGDGVNDLFRIENLSFQKASTFRVFNRYGQVVYDGMSNGNKGWDGLFKGKPSDVGTYFYQIQINYPDGKTENYKGDVTLVR